MRTRRISSAAVAGVLVLSGLISTPGQSIADPGQGTYLVRLTDAPLAAYRGGVPGLAATSPAALGTPRLDPDSVASRRYLSYLAGRQQAVQKAASGALGRSVTAKLIYRHAYHGMAVTLSEQEARFVGTLPGVASVRREFNRRLTTDAGPRWIGAPQVWSGAATGGVPGTQGEGVVVGVIDSGVNHDHPSFAAEGGDGYRHTNPRDRFFGLCSPVDGAPFCNDKLIGVWDFTGTGPLDDNGHGSHTASTAAGNVVQATVHAPTTAITRDISGVAPHANLITYKGCVATGNCASPSLVAAIDQAVADGVDVINYSIGGGPNDPWADDDSLAFLAAREAGVFVATSAGNDGPGAETVGSPANSPWLLSVGASTHDRAFVNTLADLSGGSATPPQDLTGRSFTGGFGPAPIVDAAEFGDELCGAPFPPGTFDGEIVICLRGVNPRVEKGRNVELGGAGGMVLVNDPASGDSTVADAHELPAVHIGHQAGEALRAWAAAGEGHTGTITGTMTDESPANGDVMAAFSSRGPNEPVPGVIKPDVTAPGVDVLAAVHTTVPGPDAEYGLISGTSMSSPHAAGAAALVRAVRTEWTPAEVQSALTSTGRTAVRDHGGETAADPFDRGGGRIDLTKAARAGLVLDILPEDFEAADPATEGGDPATLNLATLGNEECRGKCTWTRTVTNATTGTATWTTGSETANGLALSVKPDRFTLGPDEKATLTFTADVSKVNSSDWTFGAVRFGSRGLPTQRFPVAVRPGGTAQDVIIDAEATRGSKDIVVTTPVAVRNLTGTVYGLQRAQVDNLHPTQDPTPLDPYDTPVGVADVVVEVPEGSRVLVADIAGTTARDIDLFVGLDADGDGPEAEEEVCRSASEVALESCVLRAPKAGTYWVRVQDWLTGQGADEVVLHTGVVPGSDNGNLTLQAQGSRFPEDSPIGVRLAWDEPDLEPGSAWLALAQLGSESRYPSNVASMLVRIRRAG